MNKIFKIIGLMCLMCISFIYTEKSTQVVKQKDPIMIQLEQNKDSFKYEYIDANIDGKNIIPGYYGSEININESYDNMKKYGLYNETLIKYKTIKPQISIEDIYDKYIIKGNKMKNAVSIIFKIDETTDTNILLNILNKTNTKATFFADINYIINNREIIEKIKALGCEIEHINYGEEEIIQTNKLLSKENIIPKYCLTDNYNDNIINNCKLYSMHTIYPITLTNISKSLKKQVERGSLIYLKSNKELYESLEYIITYINQKGYNILTLEEHLDEKRLEKNLQ